MHVYDWLNTIHITYKKKTHALRRPVKCNSQLMHDKHWKNAMLNRYKTTQAFATHITNLCMTTVGKIQLAVKKHMHCWLNIT